MANKQERKGTSHSFSRVGASSLLSLRNNTSKKTKYPFKRTQNEEEARPLDAYIDALVGSVNINYQSAKKKLQQLQERRQQMDKAQNLTKKKIEPLRLLEDHAPQIPSDYFLQNLSKYENSHKPRGCAMSSLALDRYDSQRKKDPQNSRTHILAKREFQREILHLRRGIASLKTINKNK